MIFLLLRHWIAFFIPAFYKKIQVRNKHHALVKGPVIIAMNHPNAFTDPILFQTRSLPVRLNFLARGDAFKPGIITYLLESIGIVPIYRIQDAGKAGLKKNEESYQRVNYLLSRNKKVIVFAEGLCVQERRLRPLKKGVARMVFGAYEYLKNEDLRVVPVCVNYSKPHKFRSTAFYNVGEPLLVKDFYEEYQKNPARTNNSFLQVLESRMRELITHIEDPLNDAFVEEVEVLLKPGKIASLGLDPGDLYHDFLALNALTNEVNRATQADPEEAEVLRKASRAYFKALREAGLRDWLFNPLFKTQTSLISLLTRILFLLVGFPVFALAMLSNYLPFRLTNFITWKLIRVKEFYSSIAIGVGMLVFMLNYLAAYLILEVVLPERIWPFPLLILCWLAAWFSLFYIEVFKKTKGLFRVLKKPEKARQFREKREKLLSSINIFCSSQIQTPAQ